MSHRKVHSLGNVPFSWEKEPGVSKITPKDIGLYALDLPPPPPKTTTKISPSCHFNRPLEVQDHDIKISIPLPPCPSKPPRRSTSLRGGLWKQEDPFLAAYKECTKSASNIGKLPINDDQSKRGVIVGSNIVRKSKFGFSCKESCDVRDEGLVGLSLLPPLPRERSRGLFR